LINAAALFAVIWLLWRYSVRIKDVSFIDAFWAFGMVLLALGRVRPASQARDLILGLTTLLGFAAVVALWSCWRATAKTRQGARS
jgi:steroid 5-alpha reductase family enzyme